MANGKKKLANVMTAMEAAGVGFGPDDPWEEAEQVADKAFGAPTEFTQEEERMLATLTGQIQDKQPRKALPAVRSGIPGNPYSLSLTGLSQGLNEMAASVVNSRNRDDLIGDPDKVDRFTNEARSKLTRASQLRAEAEKMPDVINLDTGMDPMDNTIKFQMLEDAKALEDEAQRDIAAAEQNTGILAKARDLATKKERAVNEDAFRKEFIARFGENAYNQAAAQERTETQQKGQTERTKLIQDRLLESTRVRQREATLRARINANRAIKTSRSSGSSSSGVKIPDQVKPDYVQAFAQSFESDISDAMKDIESQAYADGTIPESLQPVYENLKWKKRFATDVDLDATFYEEADFDEGLPPTHYPSDLEQEQIQLAKQNEVPQELIDAYMYYNRISYNTAPALPGSDKKESTSLGGVFNPGNQE